MDEKDRKYYKELYEKLREKYSDEELAESFVFPPDMTDEEKAEADKELWAFRKKQLLNRTPADKMLAELLSLRYHIEDYTN